MNLNRTQNLDSLKKHELDKKIIQTKTKIKNSVESILNSKNQINFYEENFDLTREIILANIFWLNEAKKQKLSKDYSENLTMANVMQHFEVFSKYKKSSNNENYKIVA